MISICFVKKTHGIIIICLRFSERITAEPMKKACAFRKYAGGIFSEGTGRVFSFAKRYRSSLKYASPRLAGGSFFLLFRSETTMRTIIVNRYGSIL